MAKNPLLANMIKQTAKAGKLLDSIKSGKPVSDKAKLLKGIIDGADFGCQKGAVISLISALVEEDLNGSTFKVSHPTRPHGIAEIDNRHDCSGAVLVCTKEHNRISAGELIFVWNNTAQSGRRGKSSTDCWYDPSLVRTATEDEIKAYIRKDKDYLKGTEYLGDEKADPVDYTAV